MYFKFNALCAMVFLFFVIMGCENREDVTDVMESDLICDWSSEEHWMVSSIVDDLAGMARLASGQIPDGEVKEDGKDHQFTYGITELQMQPSCWDQASYVKLVKSWKPVASDAPEPALDIVNTLLTPTATQLQRANTVISGRLAKFPGSHTAHEEAAFLLGVLGMRENARDFSDIRALLGRITAHLAMAQVLRGEDEISLAGTWAEVFHNLHMGRPIVARKSLDSIPLEGASGRWRRAVEMFITGDWRRGGDLDEPRLIEVIALARAIQVHRGTSAAVELMQTSEALQAIPEWTRLLLRSGSSVEEGHIAMRSGPGMEFVEISEIFKIGAEPDESSIERHLIKDAPSRLIAQKGVPQVISDADWAAYFRRHLYACFDSVSRFTIRQWDSHEAAVEWEKSVEPYCRNLPDYELVRPFFLTNDKDYQAANKEAGKYIIKHPERVPVALWTGFKSPNIESRPNQTMPEQSQWFRDVSPPETAHDPQRRVYFEGIHGGKWITSVIALHKIDPWNRMLCYEVAENTGNNAESVKKAWGESREYSVRPLKQILESRELTLKDRIDTLKTYAGISPEVGTDLGQALVLAGKPEEAIKAYEMAFESAADRVGISNKTPWMIWYYKSIGEDTKARDIADHNAEVYSARGLRSAMTLALDEKDLARAEDYAAKVMERYGYSDGWAAVGVATGKTNPVFKSVFSDGVEKASLADFNEAEKYAGVRVNDASVIVSASGMRQGDVVMAVDGIRVKTFPQYVAVMDTTLNPVTKFIFKRGRKLMEIECILPERRLDTDMDEAVR